MKNFILSLLLVFSLNSIGQNAFGNLEIQKLDYSNCGSLEIGITVRYNKSLAVVIGKPITKYADDHPFNEDKVLMTEYIFLKTKFSPQSEEFIIGFSGGASCDLNFPVYNPETFELIDRIWAEELIIPGNGFLYSKGHNNSEFTIRKKYRFEGNEIKEIVPEFYYVGLKTRTLKPLVIYTDEDQTIVLARVPENYEIEVLAAKKSKEEDWSWNYLLKTAFGLVGWTKIEAGKINSLDVEGIYFSGD